MSETCAISIKASYDYCVGNKIVIHGHKSGFKFHFFTTMATMDRLIRIGNSKVTLNQTGSEGGREFTVNR